MVKTLSENDHTHAIMFHHFHDDKHPKSQGSLTAKQFNIMIDWLCERYSLLNADEYLRKMLDDQLDNKDICLTFDDALLCQAEIAAPILKARNIQAFFFIYSSPFMGNPDYLEVYRFFRNTNFASIDDFYGIFFSQTKNIMHSEYMDAKKTYAEKEYLKAFPFYTPNDKWFRYLRDNVLGEEKYREVMRLIMESYNFEPKKVINKLWMQASHLQKLKNDGHIIGLHSYSHPTTLHLLDKTRQYSEYKKNYEHLTEIMNSSPIAMSHPCGHYNDDTLDILNTMGIKIGFRSNKSIKTIRSSLEIPREDHSNVLRKMSK